MHYSFKSHLQSLENTRGILLSSIVDVVVFEALKMAIFFLICKLMVELSQNSLQSCQLVNVHKCSPLTLFRRVHLRLLSGVLAKNLIIIPGSTLSIFCCYISRFSDQQYRLRNYSSVTRENWLDVDLSSLSMRSCILKEVKCEGYY